MYVETFIHPDGRVFTLSTEEIPNGLIIHSNYVSATGEVTSDKEAYYDMAFAREYRHGILNMLEWSGFLASLNVHASEGSQ